MINDLVYQWGYIFVFLGPFLQQMVVLYWAEFAVFLLDEEEICCIWGFGDTNCSLVEVFLYEFVDFSLFFEI